MDKPKFTAMYYPAQGLNVTGLEEAGSPGEKEPLPGAAASGPQDGAYNDEPIRALAQSRGLPTSGADPDNVTGSIESSSPTAAEGAETVVNY